MTEKKNPKRAVASKRVPMHLCSPTLVIAVAKVMDKCGAKKDATRYDYNWRDSETSLTDYINAMKRHLAAIEDGQWLDPDSGEPHIAHIAGSCNIVLDSEAAGTLVKDTPAKSCGVAAQLKEYEDAQKEKQEVNTSTKYFGIFSKDGEKFHRSTFIESSMTFGDRCWAQTHLNNLITGPCRYVPAFWCVREVD